MKRLTALTLALILVLTALPIPSFAAETTENYDDIVYFDDGSYMTTAIIQDVSRSNSAKGTKVYRFYDGNNNERWNITISGIFFYDGTSAECQAVGCVVNVIDTAWSESSKTTSRSGDTAYANVTMIQKFLGITINTRNVSMSLTCSPNGVFS